MDGGAFLASRIGPNALIQAAAALDAALPADAVDDIFAAAGLTRYRSTPPARMVAEAEVAALHRVLRERLDPAPLAAVMRSAGRRTGDYLLAHRIPRRPRQCRFGVPAGPAALSRSPRAAGRLYDRLAARL
jgi:divinyl protochlorophyllide a 8-vinyl-reductase